MRLVNLQVYQLFLQNINPVWAQYKQFICPPLQQTIFGWDYPEEEHVLNVQFNFVGPYRSKYDNDSVELKVSKQSRIEVVQFKGEQGQKLYIDIFFEVVGKKTIIQLKVRDQGDSRVEQGQSGDKVGISLSQIGISVIGGKPRSQIIFVSLRKLQLIMMQKQQKRSYQLKIKYINIDNNLNHNTIYPVLFTPLKQRKTLQKTRPFFICLVQQNLASEGVELNYFRLAIEPISLKVYDQVVTKLYDMQQEFNELQVTQQNNELVRGAFGQNNQQLKWKTLELIQHSSPLFIRQLQIGKVIIELSFSIKPTAQGNIIIYTLLTLFRTALSNVSESQIKLNRFISKELTLKDLGHQMGDFYRKQFFTQIYKIPGSINLLGNPYVFLKYIAQGVWEIVNQPSEGFIKGPVQGAVGIVLGGVYFGRNLVAGTFNSLEVISQSCSRGLSFVTFDQKFITRRDKIQMQKSKHIGQGSKSALFAVYTGIQVALTGLYRHPKQDYQKDGALGLVKGTLKGLAGLFTKPLSGLFEGVSKFSEGIKQTALYFQDGPNNIRSRPPRVFIGNQHYFAQYSVEESKAINLLEYHSTKHLHKTILVVSVDYLEGPPEDYQYTVLTSDYLVMLSKNKKKIIEQMRVDEIQEVDPDRIPSNELQIIHRGSKIVLKSHKAHEFYQCFKFIFNINQYEDQEPLL